MNRFKLLVVATFIMLAAGASAQSSNHGVNSNIDPWTTLKLSFHVPVYDDTQSNDSYFDEANKFGFQLGLVHGFHIGKGLPFFIETGGVLKWNHIGDSNDLDFTFDNVKYHNKLKYNVNMMSLEIPVNLIYKLSFSEKFVLKPQFGLYASCHLFGTEKDTYQFDSKLGYAAIKELEREYPGKSINIFSKDDMGEDNSWHRFNVGTRIGASADIYKVINVGMTYAFDFAEIAEDCRYNEFTISVGYNF